MNFQPQIFKDGKVTDATSLPNVDCPFAGCVWKGPALELAKHNAETHAPKCQASSKAT